MPKTQLEKWLASLLLLFLLSFPIAGKLLWDKALLEGIKAYHNQCSVGGIIIDEHGQAIICGPLSKSPKEEQQKWKEANIASSLFS